MAQRVDTGQRPDILAAGALPTFQKDLHESCCRGSVHERLNVMKGGIGIAVRVPPALVLCGMRLGIPTPLAQVEAAAPCDLTVDGNDLLVLACPHRVGVIGNQMYARVLGTVPEQALAPGRISEEQRFALQRVDGCIVPEQEEDVQ